MHDSTEASAGVGRRWEYLGNGGRPERGRVDGVTNGDVAVGTHHCQQQRARELVHRRRRHINLLARRRFAKIKAHIID